MQSPEINDNNYRRLLSAIADGQQFSDTDAQAIANTIFDSQFTFVEHSTTMNMVNHSISMNIADEEQQNLFNDSNVRRTFAHRLNDIMSLYNESEVVRHQNTNSSSAPYVMVEEFLKKAWTVAGRATADDWEAWLHQFQGILFVFLFVFFYHLFFSGIIESKSET